MEKLHERQIWLPVANMCATGLLIEHGERTPISPFPVVNGKVDRHPPQGMPRPNFTCPSEGHLGDTTYRLLQSIPTQPDALLAYLKAGKKWTNDDPPTEIGDMIRETIMPPALAAALYRLAATLPGATLVPHATNAAGRAGIGIMWTSKTAKQVYKNEWIFDKTTLRFIGERTYDPKTGQVTGESAITPAGLHREGGPAPVAPGTRTTGGGPPRGPNVSTTADTPALPAPATTTSTASGEVSTCKDPESETGSASG